MAERAREDLQGAASSPGRDIVGARRRLLRTASQGEGERIARSSCRKDESGFAVVFVLFAIMVISILGALTLLYTAYALRSAGGGEPSTKALAAAEAGIEIAHARLAAETITSDTDFSDTLWNGKGSYDVTVENLAPQGYPYDWRITSAGQYKATVEGVERTFYRTIEEVVTFAGKDYYDALNFVLFSKEGKIDLSLAGNLQGINITDYRINGNVYAGGDINLKDELTIAAMHNLRIDGSIYSERGDINLNNKAAGALQNFEVTGSIYTRNGGVSISNELYIFAGCNTRVYGDIQAGGTVSGTDRGVYLRNGVFVGGAAGLYVGGTTGNIFSRNDVIAESYFGAFGGSTIDIAGSVHSGRDFRMKGDAGGAGVLINRVGGDVRAERNVEMGNDIIGAGAVANRVGGSIRAGGKVDLRAGCGGAASAFSRVESDIVARGDVNVGYDVFALPLGESGYKIGGNIYGNNVTLRANVDVGVFADIQNRVGGNIYARGALSLNNEVSGLGTIMNAAIDGSIYSQGNTNMRARAGASTDGRVFVKGLLPAPQGLDPSWRGIFVNGNSQLRSEEDWFIVPLSDADIVISNDWGHVGTASTAGNGNVTYANKYPVGSFTVPQAGSPGVTAPQNLNYNVMMPECDFDYYRSEAKRQQELDPGSTHYRQGDLTLSNLTIPAGAMFSSQYVLFVDGNLTLNNTLLGIDVKAVFVATGNITVQNSFQTAARNAYQFIAGEKVRSGSFLTLNLQPTDEIFVYAAHKGYQRGVDEESVRWDLGWFRNIQGQITARGDINLYSGRFGQLFNIHGITYKRPTVITDAFRIPLQVKSWKEK